MAAAKEPAHRQREQRTKPRQKADDYKDKLIKYVLVEVLAFFVPITAFVGAGQDFG